MKRSKCFPSSRSPLRLPGWSSRPASEAMTWKQIKAEALRIVDEVAQRKSDLELARLATVS
jgi:hypothetical protein